MQYGYVMAFNSLDEDTLVLGAKLDGISGAVGLSVGSLLAWVLEKFTPLPQGLGFFIGSMATFAVYIVSARRRSTKRTEAARENEELMGVMFRDYSDKLEKLTKTTRYDEWQRILVEISESILTFPNQQKLERNLIDRYKLHRDPMLEEILEITKQGYKSASQEESHKFTKDRPISPQRSEKEAEDNVEELLKNTSGVVDVKRNVRIGKYMADFVVTNDKEELFCVEVKSSQKNQTIYNNLFSAEPKRVQTQIQSMISAGLPNLTIDGFRKAQINAHSRIFIAKLKFQKSKSEEE
jgi:hypothetical protein